MTTDQERRRLLGAMALLRSHSPELLIGALLTACATVPADARAGAHGLGVLRSSDALYWRRLPAALLEQPGRDRRMA